MEHPGEPIVVSHDTAEERASELRNPQHRFGGRIDRDWFEVAINHDDRVGKAIEDLPPQIAGGFLDGAEAGGTGEKVSLQKDVLKGIESG